MGNREIAHELALSEHTTKKYLFRIFEKLGIFSRVELVLYAVNHGDPRPSEWLAGIRTHCAQPVKIACLALLELNWATSSSLPAYPKSDGHRLQTR